jgi:hypothetical protein
VFFTGSRTNECYQRCEVFVGEVLVTGAGEYDIVDREGHVQGRVAITGKDIRVPVIEKRQNEEKENQTTALLAIDTSQTMKNPKIPTTTRSQTPRSPDDKNEADKDNGDTGRDIYINPQITATMIRDTVRGVLGTPVGVDLWYHRVCRQERNNNDYCDDFAHAEHLTRWYLRWRDISVADFVRKPAAFPDVLQFVVAHACWSYPYGADTCVQGACESFNTPRWIDSVARSGDCEDLAAATATLFYTLQRTPCVSTELSRALCALARQYRCWLVDAVIRVVDRKEAQLHAYVRLISTQMHAPEILIDSTHRLWHTAPAERSLWPILTRLYEAMRMCTCDCDRPTCPVCHDANLADMFTWATPPALLQKLTHNMYQYELRYFEPRTRRVYAPVHRDTGVLGARFNDVELHNLPSVDITHRFRRAAALAASPDSRRVLSPPVPGLVFHKGRGAIGSRRPALKSCVPVFLREPDALRVFRTSPAAILWFEAHCANQKLQVVAAERLYVHAPELYNWVLFVK